MNSPRSRFAMFISFMASIALVTGTAVLPGAVANTAATYAIPSSPIVVSSSATNGGIKVTWNKVTANPPVTSYIVSAGPGSCPVIVSGKATSAVLPIIKGSDDQVANVQAVNAYGISDPGSDGVSVTVRQFAKSSVRNLQIL